MDSPQQVKNYPADAKSIRMDCAPINVVIVYVSIITGEKQCDYHPNSAIAVYPRKKTWIR
jgi:hypothetical protein